MTRTRQRQSIRESARIRQAHQISEDSGIVRQSLLERGRIYQIRSKSVKIRRRGRRRVYGRDRGVVVAATVAVAVAVAVIVSVA
jgi:hypothetical protein